LQSSIYFNSALLHLIVNHTGGKSMTKYKLVNTLNIGDVLVQTLVWLVLVVFTLGLALPFFAYFFLRLIINKTEIHEIS